MTAAPPSGATRTSAPVTLLSNVVHSVHTAAALAEQGLLRDYLGPVVRGRPLPGWLPGVRRFNEARVQPAAQGLPLRRLALSEAGGRLAARSGSPNDALLRHARISDAEVKQRLRPTPILHFHASIATSSVLAAKAAGSFLVCDHRSVHPDELEQRDPLRERLLAEFDAADVLVVATRLAAHGFLKRGFAAQRVHVVPLGVDLQRFGSPARPPADDQATVLFVGQHTRRKGVDLLLEAVAAVPTPVRVRLVGAGAEECARTASASGILVSAHEPVSQVELAREYAAADILVLPSRHDAFGLVAVEAMASGTPVLVTDGCGVAELVDEEVGLVVPAGSAAALRDGLVALLSDKEALRARGRAAAARAGDLGWHKHSEAIARLYRDVVLPRAGLA